MFRNQYITTFLGLLLIGAFMFSDTGNTMFEIEEWEYREIEKEDEVRDGKLERDWLKLLLGWNTDWSNASSGFDLIRSVIQSNHSEYLSKGFAKSVQGSLYLIFCCPKLPSS